ncbi:nucleotidyltransferase family protein [Lachnoanaerobaculum sp. Marseille-Q4761]|jgi:hypothetical protein|uniref:nucleotidyltransferase family protein n=1 Tax=Lachnoanaerobaculum sp. Marseille-Q4761 TaxID=2819511 RepID=UPI001AA144F0|nr:nucleotidyltransferase family protein [Lachnoanaerobaculum sp. Marseille-Q4761]MBO1871414.1 nucleotidyltransferase family protein [Lachnoanaerobaculum sp. Marseille-Q4761]
MDLVILAAGEGKRFGGDKLLADIKGIKLYQYMEKIYNQAYDFDNKIIVSKDGEILEYYKGRGFTSIYNDKPELGKSRSIKLAVEELKKIENSGSALFGVCDQPLLRSDTISKIIDEFQKSNKTISSVRCGNRLGNPCIFSNKYFDELLRLGEDEGGKKLIKAHICEVLFVDIENEDELMDIDTKDAYNYVLKKIH